MRLWKLCKVAISAQSNVDLLILPGHTSHVLQPFDISIASPLKREFKEALIRESLPTIEDLINGDPHVLKKATSAMLRKRLVESFLTALNRSCTFKNIRSGFRAAGLFPLDPSVPLTNCYVRIPI
jgi:hypothetical protein